MNWIL